MNPTGHPNISKMPSSLDLEKAEMSHIEAKADPDHYEEAKVDSVGLESDEEKRVLKSLLWKLDTRMLPMLAVLFLFSFLDRTNIGNAKVSLTFDWPELTGRSLALLPI